METQRSPAAQKMQQKRRSGGAPSSAQSLRAPGGTGCQTPRVSAPAAPVGNATVPSNEEVHSYAPAVTPRSAQANLAKPPPTAAGNSGTPRRNHGGNQPLQPNTAHRQVGSNVSPRIARPESKPGHMIVDHTTAAQLDFGDKENCDRYFHRDHVAAMKLQDAGANSEHLAMAFAEHSARLSKREQEIVTHDLQHQSSNLQLQEQRLPSEELARLERHKEEIAWRLSEERTILLDRIGKLEAQNSEMTQDFAQLTKEKQAEVSEKESYIEKLHARECEVHRKDVQLQEMKRVMEEKEQRWAGFQEVECLMHDKDQTLQQTKHEHQKQEAALRSQILDLQTELQSLQHRNQEEAASLHEAAERQVAADRHQQEKEIRALWQKVHDQKTVIRDQEVRYQKTCGVGSFITPGDFMRMMKSSESRNSCSVINARQFSRITELESLQGLHEKEIDLHCRHLPAEVIDADKQEAIEYALAQSEYISGHDLTRPEPCDEPQDGE